MEPACPLTPFVSWEIVQHLILRLEEDGEDSAAELLRAVPGEAEPARELAYRLYHICERKNWAADALAYNGLIASWPRLSDLATRRPPQQTALGLPA